MKGTIIDTSDEEAWCTALAECDEEDVYYLPEYYRVHEANGDGSGLAFVGREGGDTLFYPFLIRDVEYVGSVKVDGGWRDIETAYGYGGPLSTTTNPDFLESAWRCFDDWCGQNRVVAEFVRFHPLLETQSNWCPRHAAQVNRTTVSIGLRDSPESMWETYTSVHRNMVRKAEKMGACYEVHPVSEAMGVFRGLYGATMRRLEAPEHYYFSDGYFDAIERELEESARVILVRSEDQVVAAGMFFFCGSTVHYHLAGSDDRFRSWGVNNLLLHSAAIWGIRQGCRLFHLGGGRSADPEDGLLRFKKRVGSRRHTFYVGRKVHHVEQYGAMCDLWRRQQENGDPPPHFLLYRL